MTEGLTVSDGSGRRPSAEEVVAEARARHGVALVGGLARVRNGSDVEQYGGLCHVFSFTRLTHGHVMRQTPGSRIEWETYPVPPDVPRNGVVVVLPMAFGNGAPYPQPSGVFDLYANGTKLLTFTAPRRSEDWSGADCRLYVERRLIEGRWYGESFSFDQAIRDESWFADGYAYLWLDPKIVKGGEPVVLRITARTPAGESRNWVRLGERRQPGNTAATPFHSENVLPGVERVLRAPALDRIGDKFVAHGDLHNHSGYVTYEKLGACGMGERDSLFEHARDVARMDFFCLSEHDWQLDPDGWRALTELNDKFDAAGIFATIPGFEWTSANHGHRNVYYRDTGGPFYPSKTSGEDPSSVMDGDPTPADLWQLLRGSGVPAITVPHHSSLVQFPVRLDRYHEPVFDRVAEIYSCWGDSLKHDRRMTHLAERHEELALIEAVRRGYRFGFIASSDSHDGQPGTTQGTGHRNQLYHWLGSGFTGVHVEQLTREAVFDAIVRRQCYASTNGDIALGAWLGEHPMGSEVPAAQIGGRRPQLRIEAAAPAGIDHVAIYRSGHQTERIDVNAANVEVEWSDDDHDSTKPTSYFVEIVGNDQERAWSSPIWIDP